jgi:hypothetical protein
MTRPTPKRETERATSAFARGGKGAPNKMLPEAAAGPAEAGITGKAPTKPPAGRFAKGGPRNVGYGLALPAQPGCTAPARLGKGR